MVVVPAAGDMREVPDEQYIVLRGEPSWPHLATYGSKNYEECRTVVTSQS